MHIGVVRDHGLGLFVEGQRIGGIALVQIILSGIHQAEELIRRTIRRGNGLVRGTGWVAFASHKAKRQQKQAR